MKNEIYYSIVIPFHNRVELFARSIESILNQTYPFFELILVNDHSDSEAVEFAKEYSQRDSRVVVIDSERRGAQAARNTGILKAKYEWIMFNDSDDEWMPEKLERYDRKLKEEQYNKRCILYSDYRVLDVADGSSVDVKAPEYSKTDSFREVLFAGGVFLQCISSSKWLLTQMGMLDENVPAGQEWDTVIGLSKNGYLTKVPYISFIYNVNTGKSSFDTEKKNQEGHTYIYNKYRDNMVDVIIDDILRCPSIKEKERIAVWGYGKIGRLIVEGFARRDIDVLIIDSFVEGVHRPAELKTMVGETFVVVSLTFGYADVEEKLKEFGYKDLIDYLCVGRFYSVHRMAEMMVWNK